MSLRTITSLGLLAAVLTTGCVASSGSGASRVYQRRDLDKVPLRSIDIVVEVANSEFSELELKLRPYPPVSFDSALGQRATDAQAENAVVRSLARQLKKLGYQLSSGPRPNLVPAVAQKLPLQVKTSSLSVTSTTSATVPPVVAVVPKKGVQSAVSLKIVGSQTLREVCEASTADAVLVVRAIPIDRFYIFQEQINAAQEFAETENVATGGVGGNVRGRRPVLHEGRLLFGQAFLLDRRTGLRLWSKHLPDFPENGEIIKGHPILEYGIWGLPGQVAEGAERATSSAEAFTQRILNGFPFSHVGHQGYGQELSKIDVEAESRAEEYLDQGHLYLEIGTGWSLEQIGTDVVLDESVPLPSLGTGALAPSGAVRFARPRFTYVASGGWSFGLEGSFGTVPTNFSRSINLDDPRSNPSNPMPRTGVLAVDSASLVGGELQLGKLFFIGENLHLAPRAGLFLEAWQYSISPPDLVSSSDHLRGGVHVGTDLHWLLAAPFYWRVGGGFRLGLDNQGPGYLGFDLSTGVGFAL